MADIVLSNADGKVWQNQAGKILTKRPMSQVPLYAFDSTSPLAFWGSADPNYLTIVDGKVSEAYDIRGNGNKMIQNTSANRPILISNYLNFANAYATLTREGSVFSPFIVMYGANWFGIGHNYSYFMGTGTGQWGCYPSGTFYINNIRYSSVITRSIGIWTIIHAVGYVSNAAMLGSLSSYTGGYIKEWGWYNRALTDLEAIYNINALNAKHSIF